jgi:L-lactate utilization protein LutC
MKTLATITRNQQLIRMYVNYILVDKKSLEQAFRLIVREYNLEKSTVLKILKSNYYKRTYAEVRNCQVKIKRI